MMIIYKINQIMITIKFQNKMMKIILKYSHNKTNPNLKNKTQ